MSCRVQNKKVDHAFFGWLLQKARARGVERVTVSLSFRSTGRNEPAGQVLNEMNFEELENANSHISPRLDGLPHWDIVAVPDCARADSYESEAEMSIMTRILDRVRREIALTVHTRTVRMRNLRPIVSFSFDDFPKSAVTNGARLLECHGVTGTFFYCRSFNGRTVDELDYYNIDDLRRLISNGHELGCHTGSHILVSRYSRADLLTDIEENATYLREQLGDVRMTTFAFPFGDINLGSKILLQEHFAACRTTAPGLNHGSVDLGALKARRLYSSAINLEGVTRLIKEAAASNAWLIFYTHDVDAQPRKGGCTPGLFEAALETALAEHCDILPVRNALTMIGFRQ